MGPGRYSRVSMCVCLCLIVAQRVVRVSGICRWGEEVQENCSEKLFLISNRRSPRLFLKASSPLFPLLVHRPALRRVTQLEAGGTLTSQTYNPEQPPARDSFPLHRGAALLRSNSLETQR